LPNAPPLLLTTYYSSNNVFVAPFELPIVLCGELCEMWVIFWWALYGLGRLELGNWLWEVFCLTWGKILLWDIKQIQV